MKKTIIIQITIVLLIAGAFDAFADNTAKPTNLDNANEAFYSGDYEKVCTLTKEIIANKTNNDGKTEAATLLIQSLKWTKGIDYAIKEYKRIKNEQGIKSSGKSSLDEAVETMIVDHDALMNTVNDYRLIISKDPKSDKAMEASYSIARLMLLQGSWPDAIESFQKVIKNYPKSKYEQKSYMELGKLYECKKDIPNAVRCWEKSATYDPNSNLSVSAIGNICRILDKSKDYGKCIQSLKNISISYTNSSIAVIAGAGTINLLMSNKSKNDLENYCKEMEKIQNEDTSYSIAIEATKMYLHNENNDVAAKKLEELADDHPDTLLASAAMLESGRYHDISNDENKSLAAFQSAIKLYPNGICAAYAVIKIRDHLINSGDYGETKKTLLGIYNQYPETKAGLQALCCLGELCLENGQKSEAVGYFSKVVERNIPSCITDNAKCSLAQIYFTEAVDYRSIDDKTSELNALRKCSQYESDKYRKEKVDKRISELE